MDAVSTFSFVNLAWLGTQGLPLIIWPSFIASVLRSDGDASSSLEVYFARSLGFALLANGLMTLVLSGALPLVAADQAPKSGVSPYASAALVVSVLHHGSAGIYCYTRFLWGGDMGFVLGCIGSSVLTVWALYCVVFAGDEAMTSRYHKFDQSTSGFPFKNSESYRAKKKAL